MTGPSITLHPEKGVNPRVTKCRQCGKDVGVALLGNQNHKYTCPGCGAVHYGKPDYGERQPVDGCQRECQKCGRLFGRDWKKEEIPDYEPLPIEICDECRAKNVEVEAVVKAGGVFWKCKDCGSAGAIKAEAPLAKQVREKLGVQPPKPCGVEFSKDLYCPVCGVQEKGED